MTHELSIPVDMTGPSGSRSRKGLRILAFGLVLLGVCVFAWGLKYKLSLYDPPQAVSHEMPAAKLLTGREQAATPVVNLHQAAWPETPVILSSLALVFLVLLRAMVWPPSSEWAPGFRGARRAPEFAAIIVRFNLPPPAVL